MSSQALGESPDQGRLRGLKDLLLDFATLARKGRRDLVLLAAIGTAYFIMFALVRPDDLIGLLSAAARNVISLALAVVVVRPGVRRALRLSMLLQIPAHALLALGFSVLWLWLLTVTGGLLGGQSIFQFMVAPFLHGLAAAWQVFQGLFVYALVVALCVIDTRPAQNALVIIDNISGRPANGFLVREGQDLVALSASEIISIRGADDYSEVVTLDGSRLVQTRLAEFEGRLNPRQFVRVHRSAIINVDQIVRCDAAGNGRMVLQMRAGPVVAVSRSGAAALRAHAL